MPNGDETLRPTQAKFRSKCETCEEWIEEGDHIIWDVENQVAYHEGCEPE